MFAAPFLLPPDTPWGGSRKQPRLSLQGGGVPAFLLADHGRSLAPLVVAPGAFLFTSPPPVRYSVGVSNQGGVTNYEHDHI